MCLLSLLPQPPLFHLPRVLWIWTMPSRNMEVALDGWVVEGFFKGSHPMQACWQVRQTLQYSKGSCACFWKYFFGKESCESRSTDLFLPRRKSYSLYFNVPPSFFDVGGWERGNAHGGCVETSPNFREIHGGWGDFGVPSIGGTVLQIIKKYPKQLVSCNFIIVHTQCK